MNVLETLRIPFLSITAPRDPTLVTGERSLNTAEFATRRDRSAGRRDDGASVPSSRGGDVAG